MQGMNEILAPLYYVFKTDIDEDNVVRTISSLDWMSGKQSGKTRRFDDTLSVVCPQNHAEEDSFFCFVELLSDFRDHFCQQLDNSAVGIRSTISQMTQLLRRHDEELWRHLEITSKVFLPLCIVVCIGVRFPKCQLIWMFLHLSKHVQILGRFIR